jgi:hypothetical protein
MRRLAAALIAVACLAISASIALASDSGNGGRGEHPASASAKVLRARIVTGTGNLRKAVKRFRQLLGPDNGGAPGGDPKGRRELNWDSVPDEFAEPNALPSDFFNAKVAPRARGAVLETPGDHVAVSARPGNPAGAAVRFGDINPTYTNRFKTFSAPRLFSPIGSNVVNLTFRVPGTDTRAVVRGFGAVYTDIDRKENTAFQYFDRKGRSIGKYSAPVSKAGLSFLGVIFNKRRVARVRIQYGSGKLGPNESKSYDVAVMDDFLYAEPRPAG